MSIRFTILVFIALFTFLNPDPVHAYIGPGAGFALISSLLTLLISFFLAFLTLLTLPVRMLFRFVRHKKSYGKSVADKVVVLGFDGMDPELTRQFIDGGKLPNFKKLADTGCYRELKTSCPSLSPVAWSTFATGVHPARHNIYDFLMRNPNTYLPELSSSRIRGPRHFIKFGKYQIPIGKPSIQLLRKSKSFWGILGEHGIFSHIIRVPITFPPEKFNGVLLSAMCVPDIKGTQGTFSFYSTALKGDEPYTGGIRLPLRANGDRYTGELQGPENPILREPEPIKQVFELQLTHEKNKASLKIGKKRYPVKEKEFTPWIKVTFNAGMGVKVHGICQFYLKSSSPDVELYVSPIQIDPQKPALPVSHPLIYSIYLAKLLGDYGTLGLIEDTWALNENVLDDGDFLKQVHVIHKEREKQFLHALRNLNRGVCACVFDATDRVQHMFFRYLVKDHPANRGRKDWKYRDAIEQVYKQADDLVGRVLKQISDDTVLMVMSDHGFKPFIRGINLNSWLHQNGYLTLKNGEMSQDYFRNVDWEKTRAYAIGLAGLYFNIRGREKQGIVESGKEAQELKKEIINKLMDLKDPQTKKTAINRMIDTAETFKGPYRDNAPDLIVGYKVGYRISWDGAIGKTTETVFEDNTKNWSGDHGIDPELVPGVLFCNHRIENKNPGIVDLAPTILRLFGVQEPAYMDGKALELKKV